MYICSEFEMNCLNTIWELVLHRPYKDGDCHKTPVFTSPSNLIGTKSAVYIDGRANHPNTKCKKWCVEVAIPLEELVRFDDMRKRKVMHITKLISCTQ